MKLCRIGFFMVFAMMMSSAYAASSLDLNLSSNAARVGFTTDITPTGLQAEGSYLHNTDTGNIASLGVAMVGNASPGGSPLVAGVGGRLFYLDPTGGSATGTVLGLGGHFRYTWPSYNRFAIGGQLYYAPNIVAFGNANRYLEVGLRGEYEILRNASVYVGYRHINADFDGAGNVTLDTGFVAGINISF